MAQAPGPGSGGGISGSSIAAGAKKLLGDPYVYGATGPGSFDCSGLVQYVLGQLGISAPRTSEEQWAWVHQIPKSQLEPGDLVFAQFPGDNASPGHVGVYVGGGNVLSAEDPALGVGMSTLSSWSGNIVGYGKVPGASTTGETSGKNSPPGSSLPNANVDAFLSSNSGGVLADAGALLHGSAVVLDRIFGMFAPGNGWRVVFAAATAGAGLGAWKAWTAGGEDGSNLPLAIALTGTGLMTGFMAARPWPQTTSGAIKPGAYVVDVLRGEPPPAGPESFTPGEVQLTEAGLATLTSLWAAGKVAGSINGIAGAAGALGAGASKFWSWIKGLGEDLGEAGGGELP